MQGEGTRAVGRQAGSGVARRRRHQTTSCQGGCSQAPPPPHPHRAKLVKTHEPVLQMQGEGGEAGGGRGEDKYNRQQTAQSRPCPRARRGSLQRRSSGARAGLHHQRGAPPLHPVGRREQVHVRVKQANPTTGWLAGSGVPALAGRGRLGERARGRQAVGQIAHGWLPYDWLTDSRSRPARFRPSSAPGRWPPRRWGCC